MAIVIPASAFLTLGASPLHFSNYCVKKISALQTCGTDDAALIRGRHSFKFILLVAGITVLVAITPLPVLFSFLYINKSDPI